MLRRWACRKGVVSGSTAQASADRHRVETRPVEAGDEVRERPVVTAEAVAEGATQPEVVLGPVVQGRDGHRRTSGQGGPAPPPL